MDKDKIKKLINDVIQDEDCTVLIVKKMAEIFNEVEDDSIPVDKPVGMPSETLSCELEGRIKEAEYWRDQIFSPEFQLGKPTISLTDFILRIEELKASKS